jgi:transaldolase
VWIDLLDRSVLRSVELDRLIREHGVRGLTSNPTQLERTLTLRSTYDEDIRRSHRAETDAHVLERILVADARLACDKLMPIYEATDRRDGFASIDLSPLVAHDTEGAVGEAQRLWYKVARPNLMVKVPATREGVATVFRCIEEGINVNVTLLFSESRYLDVVDAYLRGLECRVARGEPIERLASVTSLFVSRVDAKVDQALSFLPEARACDAAALRGAIAIANAKVIHEDYEDVVAGRRWARLARAGAKTQRLSWASTTPKDVSYGPLHYVDALIGADTVATMTPETLQAYVAHATPSAPLSSGRAAAHRSLAALGGLGIDLRALSLELEADGVRQFADSFHSSLDLIAHKRRSLSAA